MTMNICMNLFKKFAPFLLILVLSYFAIAPFFLHGFFPMHDDTQVVRVFEMHNALLDGSFPVRLVANLGYHYGYPIFNFYAPFAYYVGAFLMAVGLDALAATKTMMVLGIVLAGVFMYLLAKEWWGRAGGLISAILYVYAPYHALNVYVRGAVAEFWAYAFVPLAFLGIYKIFLFSKQSLSSEKNHESRIMNQRLLWTVVGSLGYAGVIISHNLTAMMVTPFLFLFAFVLAVSRRRKLFVSFQKLFTPLVFGILLAAFYWLPALTEMQYTNVTSVVGGGSDYNDHFVCFLQLWDSQWGYGGSAPGCIDGLSFMIGKLHILLFFLGIAGFFLFKKFDKTIFFFLLGGIILSTFLLLQPSKFIWDLFPQMAFFQFPWRFLLLTTFFVSLIGGASIFIVKRFVTSRLIVFSVAVIIAIGIILFTKEVFVPREYMSKSIGDYVNIESLWWTTSKISDEYLPKDFQKPKSFIEVPRDKIKPQEGIIVSSSGEKTQTFTAQLTATEAATITINLAYFPGWKVFVDSQEVVYTPTDTGLLVAVPQGEHTVTATYQQTAIEKIANALSLAGIFLLIVVIIKIIYGKKTS